MSNTYPSAPGSPNDSASDTAKEQAAHLGNDAVEAGKDVGGVAKEEAGNVAREATSEAKDLLNQAGGELRDQAAHQQKRVAGGLRSIGDELDSMASNSEQSGVASDLVRQAASKANNVATWLDDRDPGSLLNEVKSFARRKPGVFIGVAAVAGVVAGRLTRSLTSNESGGSHSPSSTGARTDAARGGAHASGSVDEAGRSVPPPPVGEAPNPAVSPTTPPQSAGAPYTAPDSGFVPPVEPRREGDLP